MAYLATTIHSLYAVKYVQVRSVFTCSSSYDTIISMDDEVKFIWTRKPSISMILYLVSRYSPFADIIISVYSYVASNPDPKPCYATYSAAILTVVGMAISELILIIRTCALFGGSRKVWFGFGALWVMVFTVALWSISEFVESMAVERNPIPNIPGCYLSVASPVVFVSFVSLLVTETIIVSCTVWKCVALMRQASITPFMKVFYRDSILFYLAVFPFTLGNVRVSVTAASNLFDGPMRVTHSLLCCRIILHLRAAGLKLVPQASDVRDGDYTGPIAFRQQGSLRQNGLERPLGTGGESEDIEVVDLRRIGSEYV